MSKYDGFARLVQSEALFMCLANPHAGVRPSDILAVAMQCPPHVLNDSPEFMRFQAQQLADWFFGGPDPDWLPEALLFEEVEEVVEEYVDEFGNVIEDYDPNEYEEVGEEYEYEYEEGAEGEEFVEVEDAGTYEGTVVDYGDGYQSFDGR